MNRLIQYGTPNRTAKDAFILRHALRSAKDVGVAILESTDDQLMVNCWFGAWWLGFLESPCWFSSTNCEQLNITTM